MRYKNQIIQGDAFQLIWELPENSIDSIITSPPYFQLRNNSAEGQLGWNESLETYIERLVLFFNLARRPLKPEGTVWLNLGEKWASKPIPGFSIKKKDMIGLAWRVALALQQDGWLLRDCIIWDKLERCLGGPWNDRTINCHEYVFLLTQQEKYYFDWEAIKEKGSVPAGAKGGKGSESRRKREGVNARPPHYRTYTGYRRKRSVWRVQPQRGKDDHGSTFPMLLIEPMVVSGCPEKGIILDPFGGTATTAVVARTKGRSYTVFELNPTYVETAKCRLNQQ